MKENYVLNYIKLIWNFLIKQSKQPCVNPRKLLIFSYIEENYISIYMFVLFYRLKSHWCILGP